MSEDTELIRRQDLSVLALRTLCQLSTEQWASRSQLFGVADTADMGWQLELLKKFVRERVLESGRRKDHTVLYRICQGPNRRRAMSVMEGVLEDPSLLQMILAPKPSTEAPKSVVSRPTRSLIEIPTTLYDKIKTRADAKGMDVNTYVLSLLYADGVRPD